MRIKSISIDHWRHFENIEFTLDDDAGLVCIVGANGTGKSHLLELIAACAHRLGLSPGVEIPRGDPFNDPHKFSLRLSLPVELRETLEEGLSGHAAFPDWDWTLTIASRRVPNINSIEVEAGGVDDPNQRRKFGTAVVEQLTTSTAVHFLSFEADRAYQKSLLT